MVNAKDRYEKLKSKKKQNPINTKGPIYTTTFGKYC